MPLAFTVMTRMSRNDTNWPRPPVPVRSQAASCLAAGACQTRDDHRATISATFIDLALRQASCVSASFTLKSGRQSPYFFNAGPVQQRGGDRGARARLRRCARRTRGIAFDMLFGPAYKGIPLVTATAAALATQHGRNVPYAFNRKEAKDHGEGGQIVGAARSAGSLIVDDVITAGTAIRESIESDPRRRRRARRRAAGA